VAADFYLLAYNLTPWSLGEHQNGVELFQPDLVQWDFIEKVSAIESSYWGQYREAYADYVYGLLELVLVKQEYSKVELLLLQLTQAVPWNEASIWDDSIKKLLMDGKNQLAQFPQTEVIEYHLFELMGSLLANQPDRGNYELRWQVVQQLQLASELALALGNIDLAEQLTKFMDGIMPEEYWVKEQLGNLYLYLGESDRAREAFDVCLAKDAFHADCLSGKELIQSFDEEDKNRFFEIGQIIFPAWKRPAL
jgi:tetratricopeptide (TPR) repeat protein